MQFCRRSKNRDGTLNTRRCQPIFRYHTAYQIRKNCVLDFKKKHGIISIPKLTLFQCGGGGETMELKDLTAYAEEKYRIREEHKWADFPGFSVLVHPQTGKWVALLMRQWDMETGTEKEHCDLKCGRQSLSEYRKPYLSPPLRMRGQKWIGISFGKDTDKDVVFRLFDRAVTSGEQRGFTIVLEKEPQGGESLYRETALPFAGSMYRPEKEPVPERIRRMRRLYEYGRESLEEKARNFFRQGSFMQDYEDEAPWTGEFVCYYPTYHDLTLSQLRGYFSWRTCVRKGEFHPIPTSAAYLYVYELLNGIGTDSPHDGLKKLKAFEDGFLDSGVGDVSMRQNLRRWMLEYAVLWDLPPETAAEYMDPERNQTDASLAILKKPRDHSDEEVFHALARFGGKKLLQSPVTSDDPERAFRLLSETWRIAAEQERQQEKDLFTLCFGERTTHRWYPLANAVYYQQNTPREREYTLNMCRSYTCRLGVWYVSSYEKNNFDRERFRGFLHETDAKLRRYLKTGRYLQEKAADAWADPYIREAIEKDRRMVREAARPRITVDLSGLDQIRKDAMVTRDSLLTEDEIEGAEEAENSWVMPEKHEREERKPDLPLTGVQIRLLRVLLEGTSANEILQAGHIMPSLAADTINEALFDVFGDTVLLCEDDELSVVEDYREDLAELLGGNRDDR